LLEILVRRREDLVRQWRDLVRWRYVRYPTRQPIPRPDLAMPRFPTLPRVRERPSGSRARSWRIGEPSTGNVQCLQSMISGKSGWPGQELGFQDGYG
jgi:hypothetical protein